MTKVRGTGESIQMDEDWFVRRDGSMFPVSYTSTPIDMPDGPGVVVAFKDIEEQRAAEQALREREAILAQGRPAGLGHRPGGLLPLRQSGGARRARLRRGLRARGPARPRPRPLQVPRRHAVSRGRLPAGPGPAGGGDAAGHRGLARAQGRLDRARHLLVGALRAARRPRLGRPPSPTSRSSGAPSRRRASATSPRRARPSCASRGGASSRRRTRRARSSSATCTTARSSSSSARCCNSQLAERKASSDPRAGARAARAGHRAGRRRHHRAAPPRGRDPSRRSSPTAAWGRRCRRWPPGCRSPVSVARRRRTCGCRRRSRPASTSSSRRR